MKGFAILWTLLTAVAVIASWLWVSFGPKKFNSDELACIMIYQQNIRTPAFSAFITMGSFLLALKTTILGRLKETYDTKDYRAIYRAKIATSNGKSVRYYQGLDNLSRALGFNIIFCFATALAQMTFGFWINGWGFAIPVGFGISCLLLLMFLTYNLMSAHQEWFKKIEEDALDTVKKLDKENNK